MSDNLPLSYQVTKSDVKYYYSSPKTKGNDFYDKMDSLAEEIKELIKKIESKKDEMVELAKSNLTKESPAQDTFADEIGIDGKWKIDGQEIDMDENLIDALENFYSERDSAWLEPIDKCDENNDWFISVDISKKTSYVVTPEDFVFHPNELRWEGNNTITYFGEKLVEKDLGRKEDSGLFHFELNTRFTEFETVEEWEKEEDN